MLLPLSFQLLSPTSNSTSPCRTPDIPCKLISESRVLHAYSTFRVVVFLVHIALEIPLAIQGVWSPDVLPFLQLNNTTIVLLKVRFWPSFTLPYINCGIAVLRVIAFDMPYRSSVLLSTRLSARKARPRNGSLCLSQYSFYSFIPGATIHSPFFGFSCRTVESSLRRNRDCLTLFHSCSRYKVTPEIVWGTLHGLVGLGMVAWWQVTVPLTSLARAAAKGS